MGFSIQRGSFTKLNGKVVLDRAGKKGSIDVTIDTASVKTIDPRLDVHTKSDSFFNVEKYPTMTFKSTKVEQVSAGKLKVTGDLTLHGVTKEVVLDVDGPSAAIKDPWGNQRAAASATTKINRQDFGVKWNKTIDNGGAVGRLYQFSITDTLPRFIIDLFTTEDDSVFNVSVASGLCLFESRRRRAQT